VQKIAQENLIKEFLQPLFSIVSRGDAVSFEFVNGIADFFHFMATKCACHSALIQPMAADDVASCGSPDCYGLTSGMAPLKVGGPEKVFVSMNSSGEVWPHAIDPRARLSLTRTSALFTTGVELSERTLRSRRWTHDFGETCFDTWLTQPAAKSGRRSPTSGLPNK